MTILMSKNIYLNFWGLSFVFILISLSFKVALDFLFFFPFFCWCFLFLLQLYMINLYGWPAAACVSYFETAKLVFPLPKVLIEMSNVCNFNFVPPPS